jgi:hypothetical protein
MRKGREPLKLELMMEGKPFQDAAEHLDKSLF